MEDKINRKTLLYKLVNSYLCVLNENILSSFFEFVTMPTVKRV